MISALNAFDATVFRLFSRSFIVVIFLAKRSALWRTVDIKKLTTHFGYKTAYPLRNPISLSYRYLRVNLFGLLTKNQPDYFDEFNSLAWVVYCIWSFVIIYTLFYCPRGNCIMHIARKNTCEFWLLNCGLSNKETRIQLRIPLHNHAFQSANPVLWTDKLLSCDINVPILLMLQDKILWRKISIIYRSSTSRDMARTGGRVIFLWRKKSYFFSSTHVFGLNSAK